MANVNVTICMEENLKRQADELFSDLGMTLSSAMTVFVKQAIHQQAIPFTISWNTLNEDTMEAIEEVRKLKGNKEKKTYSSFDEMLKEELI